MITRLLYAVTDLGDSAVTTSLALLFTGYLCFYLKEKRAALAMAFAYGLTATIIAMGKLILYSHCALIATIYDLQSPSGHSALSFAVYITGAIIIAHSYKGWHRFLPLVAASGLVMMIAYSRYALGLHTMGDVLAGLAIGGAVTGSIYFMRLKGQRFTDQWDAFTLSAIAALFLLYGLRFPGERLIMLISDYIQSHSHPC